MSALVVGLSHRTAPLEVLDAAALTGEAVAALLRDVLDEREAGSTVEEVVVLATCNRVEVYAEVSRFHGGIEQACDLLLRHGSLDQPAALPFLYVHYEDRAVEHLFSVAAGLDSLVVGESQILGQVRESLRQAQSASTVGRNLNDLFQTALRVGKRAHAETGIDAAGRSLVSEALAAVAAAGVEPAGSRALVLGAGSMATLAASTLAAAGARRITVASRSLARAERLAAAFDGDARPWHEMPEALGEADLVVSCTGSAGVLVSLAQVEAAVRARSEAPATAPGLLGIVDLALPHDVDPAARSLDGVAVVTLADLAARVERAGGTAADVDAVRAIVAEEVASFVAQTRAARVAPTVVALRALADEFVASELARLVARRPDLDAATREEVAAMVHRVVGKLLHEPTVRVKQMAGRPDGPGYEQALRELFALDSRAVAAVSSAAVLSAADPVPGSQRSGGDSGAGSHAPHGGGVQ